MLRQNDKDLDVLFSRVDICIDQHVRRDTTHFTGARSRYVDLLVSTRPTGSPHRP